MSVAVVGAALFKSLKIPTSWTPPLNANVTAAFGLVKLVSTSAVEAAPLISTTAPGAKFLKKTSEELFNDVALVTPEARLKSKMAGGPISARLVDHELEGTADRDPSKLVSWGPDDRKVRHINDTQRAAVECQIVASVKGARIGEKTIVDNSVHRVVCGDFRHANAQGGVGVDASSERKSLPAAAARNKCGDGCFFGRNRARIAGHSGHNSMSLGKITSRRRIADTGRNGGRREICGHRHLVLERGQIRARRRVGDRQDDLADRGGFLQEP